MACQMPSSQLRHSTMPRRMVIIANTREASAQDSSKNSQPGFPNLARADANVHSGVHVRGHGPPAGCSGPHTECHPHFSLLFFRRCSSSLSRKTSSWATHSKCRALALLYLRPHEHVNVLYLLRSMPLGLPQPLKLQPPGFHSHMTYEPYSRLHEHLIVPAGTPELQRSGLHTHMNV